jgi:hypothetical protein
MEYIILALAFSAQGETLSQPQQALITRNDGRQVWCLARQVLSGSTTRQGHWVVQQELTQTQPAGGAADTGTDPYGFGPLLNQHRAALGLPALVYHQQLTDWAAVNNAEQNRLGSGHHYMPVHGQVAAWNYDDGADVLGGWLRSPAHRAVILGQATQYGIHQMGRYWTANVR